MSFLDGIALSEFVTFFLGALGVALMGGWHCAGMCGGLAALATTPQDRGWAQLGRLISYVALGVVASLFGARILSTVPEEWRWLAAVLLASLSFWIMLSTWNLRLPGRAQRFLWRHRPRGTRSGEFLFLGVLNGLLPCHWLYGFLVSAAALGDPGKGAVLLAALWLGSLPWLLGFARVGAWMRRLTGDSPWLGRAWLALVLAGLMVQVLPSAHSHANATPREPVICGGSR